MFLGTIYNVNTPDLYKNNAHHKIGWIVTWVMTAQVTMSLLFVYSSRTMKASGPVSERVAFLPLTVQNMTQQGNRPYHDYRWSGDSGQGTERSSIHQSRDISPSDPHRQAAHEQYSKSEAEPEDDDDEPERPISSRSSFLHRFHLDKYLSNNLPRVFSQKVVKVAGVVYDIVDGIILIIGFIALISGGVTYCGIFVSPLLLMVLRELCGADFDTSVQAISSMEWHTLSKVESSSGMDC